MRYPEIIGKNRRPILIRDPVDVLSVGQLRKGGSVNRKIASVLRVHQQPMASDWSVGPLFRNSPRFLPVHDRSTPVSRSRPWDL